MIKHGFMVIIVAVFEKWFYGVLHADSTVCTYSFTLTYNYFTLTIFNLVLTYSPGNHCLARLFISEVFCRHSVHMFLVYLKMRSDIPLSSWDITLLECYDNM